MDRGRGAAAAMLIAVTLGASACGDQPQTPAPEGTSVGGPGMLTSDPPWRAQYAGIKRRLAKLALPATGNEQFHTHQLLHIYNDGLLVPVAANIGVDERQGVESALHTHDSSGVVHMEASRPFRATLGDLFTLWGVSFGPDRIGSLKASADKPLRVFVNGRQVADPAAHVLAKNDNVVIAYGSMDGVPRVADTTPLRAANGKGGAPVACSVAKPGKKATSCFKSKRP